MRNHLYKIDYVVYLFLITLVRIPQTIIPSLRGSFLVVMFILIVAVILKNVGLSLSYTTGKFTFITPNIWIFFGITTLWLLICITYIRAISTGVISTNYAQVTILLWTSILIMGISSFLAPDHYIRQKGLKQAISLAASSYIIVNVFLYFLNTPFFDLVARFTESYQEMSDLGQSVLLSYMGININRVLFPTAIGVNGVGPITGAAVIVGILLITENISKRGQGWNQPLLLGFGVLSVITGCFVLLSIDSRFSLFSVIATVGLVKFLPKTFLKRAIITIVIVSPILPYFIPVITEFADRLTILTTFSRHSNDIISLNSRIYVWDSAYLLLSETLPQHLVGYGFRSQAVSENAPYLYRFALRDIPEFHNYSLQYIFDAGYIGLAIFITFYVITFIHLVDQNQSKENILLIALLTHFMIISTVEVAITYYNQEVFTALLLIFTTCLPQSAVEKTHQIENSIKFTAHNSKNISPTII